MRETIRRAARTFVQTAAGYISVNIVAAISGAGTDGELIKTAVYGIIISAVAAGLAAVMNLPGKGE